MELRLAKEIAVKICYKLQPHCDKINIAGGIRRQKPYVHDIEIICLPKTEKVKIDLFENIKEVRCFEFMNIVNKLGKIVKGNAGGKMMQINLPESIMLDLFIPDSFDYFRQYAIRTGNADYSQRVIATGWNKIGWCGSDKGLRKQGDCTPHKTPDNKTKWVCNNPLADLPPIWIDEKDFFNWIKQPYLEPKLRN